MKITDEYTAHGTPAAFYASHGASYRNPQEREVRRMLLRLLPRVDLSAVLDLACGSGEVTLVVREAGGNASGIDPFTGDAYLARTGQPCEALSFQDIAATFEDRNYSCIVCSFALHLLDESYLPATLAALARWSTTLLVLTPHKRPELRPEWGWHLVHEDYCERVRARLYTSQP